MSIVIRTDKCVGCGKCREVCPGSLITKTADGKAFMKYPKDCWGCASCVKECAVGAISFYLGADIGGRGSSLTVSKSEGKVYWNIKKYDNTIHTIEINPKDSNQY